jgi:hypothetical protein
MALAMSMLAVGSPAFADNVGVTVNSQFIPFNSGDTQLLKITVTNGGAPSITVSVSGLSNFTAGNPQGCNTGGGSSCTINFGPGDKSKDISFSLTATGNIDSGQSKTDHGKVSARQDVLLGGNATAAFDVTLKGPQPTQALSVPQVSGVVRDMATGSPIKNAVVVLVDSGACASGKDPCQVGTDGNGAFTFASTPDKPITPGTIQIGVTRSGYDNGSAAVAARAGQSVNVSLKLKPTAAASSSASPETLPSAEGQQSTADAVTPTVAAAAPKPAGNSAPNTFSLIIIVLAGLLVLLGVGVFVMMFLNRRKGNADGNPPFSPGDAAMGAGSGVYGGAADGADPTMVANPAMTSAMTSPGASDSTAIHRPQRPEDELPDPYAAAHPPSPAGYPQEGSGYGAPAAPYATQVGGYGVGQPAGYDSATQGYGGTPPAYGPGGMHDNEYDKEFGNEYGAGAGYGGLPAGYSPDQSYGSGAGSPRYDEATRHWDGGADGGYTGGGAHRQQQGDYEAAYGQQQVGYDPGAGSDQGYPQDWHGGGYDPYQQQQPTEAPTRRGAPQAGHGGDRQRLDWFGD